MWRAYKKEPFGLQHCCTFEQCLNILSKIFLLGRACDGSTQYIYSGWSESKKFAIQAKIFVCQLHRSLSKSIFYMRIAAVCDRAKKLSSKLRSKQSSTVNLPRVKPGYTFCTPALTIGLKLSAAAGCIQSLATRSLWT